MKNPLLVLLDWFHKVRNAIKYLTLVGPSCRACRQKNYSSAIPLLEKRLALNVIPHLDLIKLGQIYEDQANFEKAEECFRRAVELDQGSIQAKENLGNFLVRRERHDEAAVLVRDVLNTQMEGWLEKDKYAWMPRFTAWLGDIIMSLVLKWKGKPLKHSMKEALVNEDSRMTEWQKWATNYLIWYDEQKRC